MLVSIILKKLPIEIRRNLAREQLSTKWTFDDLIKAILKEIRILAAGYQVTDSHSSSSSTASFYVGLKNNSNAQALKRNLICMFCKGPHPSHSCTTVTEYPPRIDLVKRENLCLNCLGHHKVSNCTSKFHCKKDTILVCVIVNHPSPMEIEGLLIAVHQPKSYPFLSPQQLLQHQETVSPTVTPPVY